MNIAFENPMHRNSDRDSGTMSRLSDRVSQLRLKGGRKSTLTEPLDLGVSQPPSTGGPTDFIEVLICETPTHPSKDADEAPGQPFQTKMEQDKGPEEEEEDTDTTCWGVLKRTAKTDHLEEKSKALVKGAVTERDKETIGAGSAGGGSFLAKFQIITGFFQQLDIVAGLPNIAWPPMFSWLALSVSFPFSLNFSGVATSASAYLVSTVVAPLVFLLATWRFMRSSSAWKEQYVTNWSQFQWRLLEVWLFGSMIWGFLAKVLEDTFCTGDI